MKSSPLFPSVGYLEETNSAKRISVDSQIKWATYLGRLALASCQIYTFYDTGVCSCAYRLSGHTLEYTIGGESRGCSFSQTVCPTAARRRLVPRLIPHFTSLWLFSPRHITEIREGCRQSRTGPLIHSRRQSLRAILHRTVSTTNPVEGSPMHRCVFLLSIGPKSSFHEKSRHTEHGLHPLPQSLLSTEPRGRHAGDPCLSDAPALFLFLCEHVWRPQNGGR